MTRTRHVMSLAGSRNAKPDIQHSGDVRCFVDAFYAKVGVDPVLGPIFNEIAKIDWSEHLPVMYQFWETILFSRPGCKGNPIATHAELHQLMKQSQGTGLKLAEFERWLALFHETLDQLFSGERAERAKRGASHMAQHMVHELTRDQPVAPNVVLPVIPRTYTVGGRG